MLLRNFQRDFKYFFISLLVSMFIMSAAVFAHSGRENLNVFVDYHYTKGYFELYQGDFKDAVRDLWKVFPYVKSREFYDELSDMLVYSGRYYKAEEVLRKAIEAFSRDKEFYYKLFDVYTIEGKRKQAMHVMVLIKKNFKQTPETMKRMAFLYIKSGRYKDAYQQLMRYIKIRKNDDVALYYLSQVCIKLNRVKLALKYAKEAYDLKPANVRYSLLLTSLYEKVGEFSNAIRIYKRFPPSSLVMYAIGNDYYLLGKLNEAGEYYKKAFKISKKIIYLEKLAFVYFRLKKYDEVVSLCKTNRDFLHQSDRLKLLYGMALGRLNKCRKAIDILGEINPAVGFYQDAVYNEVFCFYKLKQYESVKKILGKYGKVEAYFSVVGEIYLRNKNFDGALDLLREALKRAKDNTEKAEVYFYMADIFYEDLKNTKNAVLNLRKAIQLNKNYAEALNYLGYLYIDDNIDVKEGIKLVKEALVLRKDNPYYLDSLGWGYFKIGEYNKAIKYIKMALKRYMPEDKRAMIISYEHLLEVYKKIGEMTQAKRAALELLKLSPGNKKAKEFLKNEK